MFLKHVMSNGVVRANESCSGALLLLRLIETPFSLTRAHFRLTRMLL